MINASNDFVVRLVDVNKRYGDNPIIAGLSMSVRRGEVYTLIGRSGSGKSTVLRCINALEPIQSGDIYVVGERVAFDDERQKRNVRKRIGIVFQSHNLFPHMTAIDNIMLGPVRSKGVPKAQARERALSLLSNIGLYEKAQSYPEDLSGGQSQRVAIARALAMAPDLLLLDEITSSLDPELTKEVLDLVGSLAEQGVTMVMVSHEMGFVRKVSSRVGFVDEGRLADEGTPEAVFNSEHPRIRSFLASLE